MLARPALIAAISIAAGISASPLFTSTTLFPALLLTIAVLSAALGLLIDRAPNLLRGRPAYVVAATAILFVAGSARMTQSRTSWHQFLKTAAMADSLKGRVTGPITRDSSAIRFTIRVSSPTSIAGEIVAVRLLNRARSSIPDTLVSAHPRVVIYGPRSLRQPRRNPADVDYAAAAWARGIAGTATIYDEASVNLAKGRDVGARPATEHPDTEHASMVEQVQSYVRAAIDQHVEASARPVITALLLGDRSQVDHRARDALSRTGLMHLLAVSGLHVLLVGMAAYRLLKSILVRFTLEWYVVEWIRVPLTIALLLLYAAVTGKQPSAVRAVIMGSLFLCGALVRRRPDSLNLLGVAACIILVHRPQQLFAAGFQLSFCAVAAILLIAGPIRDLLPGRSRLSSLRTSIATSLAASIGTAPILMFTFGFTPLAGLLLNIVAIPLTVVALGSGLLTVLSSLLAPALATYFAHTAGLAVNVLVRGSVVLSDFAPVLESRLLAGPTAQMIAAAVLLSGVAHLLRVRERWRYTIAFIGLAAAVVVGASAAHPLRSLLTTASLDVIFADVGQGDAAIVRTPNHRFVVIDTGPSGWRMSPATRSLVPLLHRLGARHIDGLVVSHPHDDHDGGVTDISSAFAVRHLFAERVDDIHTLRSATVRPLYAGDNFVLDGVLFEVVNPPPPDSRDGRHASANNASIVIRLTFGTTCVAFMGDAEAGAEQYLVENGAHLACDVIKVGHHGSKTSSTANFVLATRISQNGINAGKAVAVISAGIRNRFGHPDTSVVARWKRSGRRVQTTMGGAIWMRSDGSTFRLVDWRRSWGSEGP